jgi:hydrogenase maturation protease
MHADSPTLILSWGNPSRGDDAIGPAMHERLEQQPLPAADSITDFQLQIEHSTDIDGRQRVIFVDASLTAQAPFELTQIYPEKDDSFTSHALSPQALLSICLQVNTSPLPESYLLAIKGYDFALGEPMTKNAFNNLEQAFQALSQLINQNIPKFNKNFISKY